MIPQDTLSTTPAPAAFIAPRNQAKDLLIDYELGGDDIQDASNGLRSKIWTGRYLGGAIVLSAPGSGSTSVLSVAGVAEFQFTFDQNMQPFIAYRLESGESRFYWFDGTVPGFVTDDLGAGVITPRCALDDKRALQNQLGNSDIILAYIRGDTLYWRVQRDRYETEYDSGRSDLGLYQLGQIGMNVERRFQFQLVGRTL